MRIALAVALAASSSAYAESIDFEDLSEFTSVTDQYETSGVIFSGDLISSINVGSFPFEQPVIRDLGGAFGFGDGDNDLAASGALGLVTASLRFEVADSNSVFTDLAFDMLRRRDQDLHVTLELEDGSVVERFFSAPGGRGFNRFRWSEFSSPNALLNQRVKAVEIHNGGGQFGIDDLNFTAEAIPLPTTAAMAGLGLLAVGARRRRAV